MARSADSEARIATLRGRYAKGTRQLGVCVDRVDYTKGIPERIRALETLWTESPELRERFTFIFVCTPSRSDLPAYNLLERDVTQSVIAINEKFGTPDWTPIVLINENVDADLLAAVYRAADLCIVSSLQDGMNLVAKEFVACQLDERGVLILSRFTGSAEEIDGAVLINPFNVDGFVEAIRTSLAMSPDERRRRMHRMRRHLFHSTIFDWLDSILARATQVMGPPSRPIEARGERGLAARANSGAAVDASCSRGDSPAARCCFCSTSTARCRRSRRGRSTPPCPTRLARCSPSSSRCPIRTSPSCRAARSTTRCAWSASTDSGRSGTTASRSRRRIAPPMVREDIAPFADQVQAASARVSEVARDLPGVFVEDKRWTASVHYRLADPAIVPGLTARVVQIASEYGLDRHTRKENARAASAGAGRQGHRGARGRERARRHRQRCVDLLRRRRPHRRRHVQRAARRRFRAPSPCGSAHDSPASATAAEFSVADTDALRDLLERDRSLGAAANRSRKPAQCFPPFFRRRLALGFAVLRGCLRPGFAGGFRGRLRRGLRRRSSRPPWRPFSLAGFRAGLATFVGAWRSPPALLSRPASQRRRGRLGAHRRCGRGGGGGAIGRIAGRNGGIAAAAAAARAAASAFAIAAFSAAIFVAVGRLFSLAGRLSCAASASRISLSASSGVIWPRLTMYCTRSRALSMAKPAIPAAALMTSFIAAATLLPASWLISCARSAISATVSRMSAPRWPGPRRGAPGGGAPRPQARRQ